MFQYLPFIVHILLSNLGYVMSPENVTYLYFYFAFLFYEVFINESCISIIYTPNW